ncbi:MAG: site-specific DNA-methyltransferase [Candidatus Caldarchaeum sp.]
MIETIQIVCSSAKEFLETMPSETVDLILTSPPYWSLRDYGVHDDPRAVGLEKTPEEYIEKLVSIFKEARRVLKPAGGMYINLGDTYMDKSLLGIPWRVALELVKQGLILRNCIIWYKPNALPSSVKDRFSNTYEFLFFFTKSRKYYFNLDAVRVPFKNPKNMMRTHSLDPIKQAKKFRRRDSLHQATPVRAPNRASADKPGAYEERKHVVSKWINPNSPVVEHFRRKGSGGHHDYGGLNSPAGKHYADGGKNPGDVITAYTVRHKSWMSTPQHPYTHEKVWSDLEREHRFDFWKINTQPFKDAHFAVFPIELCWRPILASCPPDGVVLDPFAGSGTVGEAVLLLNIFGKPPTPEQVKTLRQGLKSGVKPLMFTATRRCILVDINKDYCEIMQKRLGWYRTLHAHKHEGEEWASIDSSGRGFKNDRS